jgi:hypothetical protein
LKCVKCGIHKDEHHFRIRPEKGYREKSCKECRYAQARSNKNRAANVARYRSSDKYKESIRRGVLKKYGLTIEEYNNVVESQDGLCAICKNPETRTIRGKLKSLSVDHDHKTGRVRGIICDNCNTILGRVKDSEDHLLALLDYLRGGDQD